jgi:hypothetical protein
LTEHEKNAFGKMQTTHTGFVGVVLLGLLAMWAQPTTSRPDWERINGVTLDARRAPRPALYDELADLGTTHVALIPYAFFREGDLRFNSEARWFSESGSGASALADSLALREIQVTLKPQVWMGNGQFPGDLDFDDASGWERFEEGYREYALHHAAIARDIDSDWFVVGTELARSAIERPEFWRSLIAEVREVFPGRLTYAANWWAEADSVVFWDDLDAIGVQAYYPMAAEVDATDFAQSWAAHSATLEGLAQQWKKPLIFTEIGYRSMSDAAVEPWAWTPRRSSAEPDPAMQAALYAAFFDGPWKASWLSGAYIWKWYGQEVTERQSLDFTPQGKPAEALIRRAFQAQQ